MSAITPERIAELERLEAAARAIIRDTLWMARRYADGRKSYAAGMYNDAARKALALGIVQPHPSEPMLAHDAMGAGYANLSPEEHAAGVTYACAIREAETQRDAAIARAEKAEREVAELREALKPFATHLRFLQMTLPGPIYADGTTPIYGEDYSYDENAPFCHALCTDDFRRAAKAVAPNGEGRDAG